MEVKRGSIESNNRLVYVDLEGRITAKHPLNAMLGILPIAKQLWCEIEYHQV